MTRPERTTRPAWATPLLCAAIVLLLTVPRALFSARFGLLGDEAYYAVWSLHPGFGYYDHSPAVAWVIWLGRMIFGEGEFAVRSLFLVSSLVACATLYRMGRLIFGDARIGALAAIFYAVTPGMVITFAVATPDGPSTLFWLLSVWAVAEFAARGNANWWLAAGAFAGLGLLSKYTVVFLGAGLLLYLLTSRERRGWFRLWQLWGGGAIAVLAFLPVVWIDWSRDWISFRYQLGRSTLDEASFAGLYEFIRFLAEESIQLLPTLFVFTVLGLLAFFARRDHRLALPVLTAVPMLGYFLVHALFGRVNPNWTAPLFPQLALVGAWAAIAIRPRLALFRWPLNLLRLAHVPLGLALLLTAYAAIEWRALPGVGPLPVFDYVYGWDNLQRRVSDLAREHDARWIDAEDYSLTGWLGYYGRMADDPLPVFQTNAPFRYTYRPPMDEALRAAPHLIVQYARAGEQPEIPGARFLGLVTRDDAAGKQLAAYAVYLANG